MEHEISAIDVLHDKEEVIPSLEAGVKAGQEWRLLLHGKDLTLVQGALYIVFLNDQVLLQALDGVDFLTVLVLSQKHLQRRLAVS